MTKQDRREVKAFVLLGRGFGASNWAARYARGMIPGINEALPYGYHLAAGEGWNIRYSEDAPETKGMALLRRALRRGLGFDIIHAIRHRRQLFSSDIVWTHTEFEHLAALTLFRAGPHQHRPLVLANCIWLFDRWRHLSRQRQTLIRGLVEQANVVTAHCEAGISAAHAFFPNVLSRKTAFGIRFSDLAPRKVRPEPRPIRVLAIGNDVHRDWSTLLRAVLGLKRVVLTIASHGKKAPKTAANIRVVRAYSEREVLCLYDWADLVAVILRPNLHASGITAVLEATARSVPVIATDTVGLRDYFGDNEICYVPAVDHRAISDAIENLTADHTLRHRMVEASLQRAISSDYTSRGHALRCRSASEELMS